MVLLLVCFLLEIGHQENLPYKPDAEFAIRVELKFMQRPPASTSTVNVSESLSDYKRRISNEQLPYLNLFITVKEANQGETRIRIMRDGKLMANRKIDLGKEFKLEVGFVDDAKDQVSGYEHVIYFLTPDKKDINRIVIRIDSNGDYYINDVKSGRF
ncbi:MAG: hypothetical protein KF687_10735 [Cyclobacteriaceae bacterium]|nr:hypothetical protein [Cyclobacteriaceae bacterium]